MLEIKFYDYLYIRVKLKWGTQQYREKLNFRKVYHELNGFFEEINWNTEMGNFDINTQYVRF